MDRNSLSLTSTGSENPAHFFHANGGPSNFPCMLGPAASRISVPPLIDVALEGAALLSSSASPREDVKLTTCLKEGRLQSNGCNMIEDEGDF